VNKSGRRRAPAAQDRLRDAGAEGHPQQELRGRGEVFNDQIFATTILDRRPDRATTVTIQGDSYRLRERKKAAARAQPKGCRARRGGGAEA
jgi:hypothetical protein